jgi:hypothetical protein
LQINYLAPTASISDDTNYTVIKNLPCILY